jgi:hypothetical protein
VRAEKRRSFALEILICQMVLMILSVENPIVLDLVGLKVGMVNYLPTSGVVETGGAK